MYLLNDGRTLEISFDSTSAFSSTEERATMITHIRNSRLPLVILLRKNFHPTPVETLFLREVINTVHRAGGRVKICTTSANQAAGMLAS